MILEDQENYKTAIYVSVDFLCGSSLLILFSLIQKIFIGINPFILKGYIVPLIFGGIGGAIMGVYQKQVNNFRKDIASSINELGKFFEISMEEDDVFVHKWVQKFSSKVDSFCHVMNNCEKKECLAYQSECGRCWLQVGTLCNDKVQNNFSDKRKLCPECKVYNEYVGDDIVKNIRELTFGLIHNLLFKKQELKEVIEYEQKLTGAMEMAGAVCHEVGQPLQSILVCTNLLGSNNLQEDKREEILELLLEQSYVLQDLCGKLKKVTSYATKKYLGCSKIVDLEKAIIES